MLKNRHFSQNVFIRSKRVVDIMKNINPSVLCHPKKYYFSPFASIKFILCSTFHTTIPPPLSQALWIISTVKQVQIKFLGVGCDEKQSYIELCATWKAISCVMARGNFGHFLLEIIIFSLKLFKIKSTWL